MVVGDAETVGLVPSCCSSHRRLLVDGLVGDGETARGRTQVSQGAAAAAAAVVVVVVVVAAVVAAFPPPSNRLSRTAARLPRCRSAQAATEAALDATVARTAGSPTVA